MLRRPGLSAALTFLVVGGAGGPTRGLRTAAHRVLGRAAPVPRPATAAPATAGPATAWPDASVSPQPLRAALSELEAGVLARCGPGDEGLSAVARALVQRKERGEPTLDADSLALAQRAAGQPHVWPRAWLAAAKRIEAADAKRSVDAWVGTFRDEGERRCGIASGRMRDGNHILALVAVDALADLAPLPIRVRAGTWISVEARMLVETSNARVLVLGPSGPPRTAPTTVSSHRVRAALSLDRPGAYTIQVVAEGTTGPRPVLEASVFADVAPATRGALDEAPGEGSEAADSASALAKMVGVVRRQARLGELRRDARLDTVALAHARRMCEARTVAHDVGDGDPRERLRIADLEPKEVGENVAHAPSLALAHRTLYGSPSHRANMLQNSYDSVGVASVSDADGSVWVVELFASRP